MNTEELKRLAEAATPGPWYDRAGVLRGTGGGIKPIATIYNGLNSPYIAAANPAAILALIAEIDSLRDEVNGLTGELESERKRLDWALKHDSFFDHTTGVFFCDPAFKIPQPQVRIETDNFRATIDELMVQS